MGLLSCYSISGRKSKIARTVSVMATFKDTSRATRVVLQESKSELDSVLVQDTDTVAGLSRGVLTASHFVVDCTALGDLILLEQSEKLVDCVGTMDSPETVVDVERLSTCPASHTNLCHEDFSHHASHLGSSCSQGTCHGGVSGSLGLGTISNDGSESAIHHRRAGGFLGHNEDGLSDVSDGERFTSKLQVNDNSSAGYVADFEKAACVCQYSDDGDQVLLEQPNLRLEDVGGDGGTHPFSQMANEEVLSGHASDPGFYVREDLQELHENEYFSPPADVKDFTSLQFISVDDAEERASIDEKLGLISQISNEGHALSQGSFSDVTEASYSRVKEWINSIQQSDIVSRGEEDLLAIGKGSWTAELHHNDSGETSAVLHQVTDAMDHVSVANAAVRSLHPSSTVAHLSGIGLRELPSLGMFSFLRTLNLSANLIVRVPVGCLPRSLHSLDLSRNRITQIEGLRELTRLRVLNLSYNRISRIGHGLANCTLIKELYLSGNKIAEVEGLHRLLKLVVLDLSFNKVTTSKALGQLAANYGSLLALNLLGNPILTNFSEDQLRKFVTALAPHVTYLNKQPIKVISVREAALDSVARAALGTSQRNSRSRDGKGTRKAPSGPLGSVPKKPPPRHYSKHADKKLGSASSSGHRHPIASYHQHHHHDQGSAKVLGLEPSKVLGGLQKLVLDTEKRAMHRSKSASVLQE